MKDDSLGGLIVLGIVALVVILALSKSDLFAPKRKEEWQVLRTPDGKLEGIMTLDFQGKTTFVPIGSS